MSIREIQAHVNDYEFLFDGRNYGFIFKGVPKKQDKNYNIGNSHLVAVVIKHSKASV